jgi:hypothetical protein
MEAFLQVREAARNGKFTHSDTKNQTGSGTVESIAAKNEA